MRMTKPAPRYLDSKDVRIQIHEGGYCHGQHLLPYQQVITNQIVHNNGVCSISPAHGRYREFEWADDERVHVLHFIFE